MKNSDVPMMARLCGGLDALGDACAKAHAGLERGRPQRAAPSGPAL